MVDIFDDDGFVKICFFLYLDFMKLLLLNMFVIIYYYKFKN